MHIHILGICGTFMGGVAALAREAGHKVTGCDAGVYPPMSDQLRALGIDLIEGFGADQMALKPDMYVIGNVVSRARLSDGSPKFPLMEAILEAGAPYTSGPQWLAEHVLQGKHVLAVAGTHGKTTTTSMLIVALQHAGLDPSFAVGGELGEAGTNAHHGSGSCFVAEADESDGSLLEYTPDVAVVTNIEADHLDFFGSAEAYTEVFDAFVDRIAPGGALVVCTDDPGAAALAGRAHAQGVRVLAYGATDGGSATVPLAARLVHWQQQGTGAVAEIQLAGETQPRAMRLSVPGQHMALNALAALLAAVEVGAPVDDVLDGLAGFEGVRRRFELVGVANGVRVFDDYAHHPTEVRAALAALRTVAEQGGGGRTLCVFQPHLYSRTKAFAREFGSALDAADRVFVLDVYAAREQPIAGVSGATVAELVGTQVSYEPDVSAVAARVAEVARPGDVVVTMGAGDVTMLGPQILAEIQAAANRHAPGRRI